MPVIWRGVGRGASADGSADVRLFQKVVYERRIAFHEDALLLPQSIAGSELHYDAGGNPALQRATKGARHRNARIDTASAAVIAVGAARELLAIAGVGDAA